MKLRKLLTIAVALVMVFALVGCNQIEDNTPDDTSQVTPDSPPVKEPYPVSVYGGEFDDSPESVVSLSPALTKLIADLGVTDKLVGISEYCDLPGLELPTVGSPANPDINGIIELKPTVVITLSPLASTDKINLSQYGITVLEIPEAESYAELCDIDISLCRVFFGAVESRDIAYDTLEPLDNALKTAKEAGISRSFICVEGVHDKGLILSGGETLEDDILSVFGKNLLGEMPAVFMDEETLSLFEPSVIFAYDSVDRDDIRDYYEDAKIIFLPESVFSQPSVAITHVIEEILGELE